MDYQSMKQLNKTRSKFSIRTILSIGFWSIVLILVLLKVVVFQQVTVVGSSMEPNYSNGQTLLMNQISKDYKRGQVVAVYKDIEVARNADYFTRFQATFFLKRIIGLPGESIEMIDDTVILYSDDSSEGKVLDEEYIGSDVRERLKGQNFYFPKTKIESDSYFLLGDNRTNSFDSRNAGAFPSFAIFGQESVRIWPANKILFFSLPQYSFSEIDETIRIKQTQLSKSSSQ